jgi:hypothetical protein
LRNRWRRVQVDEPLRSEITPKNILPGWQRRRSSRSRPRSSPRSATSAAKSTASSATSWTSPSR